MAPTLTVKAYRGDARTLLAFDLPKSATRSLAGFTIACAPGGQPPYYLHNSLRFEAPGHHAQDPTEPATSSVNAPFHKFRWIHVPGSANQGTAPFYGPYRYTVTPRYLDADGALLPLDPALGQTVDVEVGPLTVRGLSVGFTRGFTQSQGFVNHFDLRAPIRPKGKDLVFDVDQVAGRNARGQTFTFRDEYEWLGFTARARVLAVLDEALADATLGLDVFAYDLNEPEIVQRLLTLAERGRVRIILDDASLHHGSPPKPEDVFEQRFQAAAKGGAALLRGKFDRYAHDKVLVVRRQGGARPAVKVLTGSTNFSVTGLYVNSNHVLVFDDPAVAQRYADVFDAAWSGGVKAAAFRATPLARQRFSFESAATPATDVTFSPHAADFAGEVLDALAARIAQEGEREDGSVLFAVMELGKSTGPVVPALVALHRSQAIFSYGITDTQEGIQLYKRGTKNGILVTGKPVKTILPPPFSQVPGIGGVGHQVHHKFVVCGFNGPDPVVYCGSSNLALGGEEENGDNLIAIHDPEIATAFAVEALGLVDHFDFLDRCSSTAGRRGYGGPKPSRTQAAASAGWFLSTDDGWAKPYYDPDDLHCVDRTLFAG